jgi:hypothetical protein
MFCHCTSFYSSYSSSISPIWSKGNKGHYTTLRRQSRMHAFQRDKYQPLSHHHVMPGATEIHSKITSFPRSPPTAGKKSLLMSISMIHLISNELSASDVSFLFRVPGSIFLNINGCWYVGLMTRIFVQKSGICVFERGTRCTKSLTCVKLMIRSQMDTLG